MAALRSLFLFALCASAFAQTDGITVTVSRTIDLNPDQITLSLAVLTDPAVTLDQVLQATQALGLDASTFSTINFLPSYGPPPPRSNLSYVFNLTIAFSKLSETNDKLVAVRRSLADASPAMDVQLNSLVVSPTDAALDRARQGALPQLLADAKQRGDQLARAASVNLGGVLGLSESLGPATNLSGPYYGPYGPSGPSSLHTTYSLTVRYAVK
jgi:uncharacterized protein DUF541